MLIQTNGRPSRTEICLGDVGGLAMSLGSAGELGTLGRALAAQALGPVTDAASLRAFVSGYRSGLLEPVELPAICQAFQHAARFEVRELIALDQRLAQEPALRHFSVASQAVGRGTLRRLRPLRGERLVTRYWQAIQGGRAHGWHTLVYGVVIAIYSLPLRPGLISYGQQTLRGFVESAGCRLGLATESRLALARDLGAGLPQAVARLLAADVVGD